MARNSDSLDAQFDAFLKESVSSDEPLESARILKHIKTKGSIKEKRSTGSPWWMQDDTSSEVGTGKSFLKKKQKPTASTDKAALDDSQGIDDISLRTTDDKPKFPGPELVPRLSLATSATITETASEDYADRGGGDVIYGKDTMDEMQEKAAFFKNLEDNAEETIDYGRLNQELSATEVDLRNVESTPEKLKSGAAAKRAADRGGMLSKVSLIDSLESTAGNKTMSSREHDDMTTIHEGGESQVTTNRGAEPAFDTTKESEDMAEDNTHLKVLKTGAMTDTSHELYAYREALIQAGQLSSTMKDFTQGSELSAVSRQETSEAPSSNTTPGFGLQPLHPAVSDSGAVQTMDEVTKDLTASDFPRKNLSEHNVHFKDEVDYSADPVDGSPIVPQTNAKVTKSITEKKKQKIPVINTDKRYGKPPATTKREAKKTKAKDGSTAPPTQDEAHLRASLTSYANYLMDTFVSGGVSARKDNSPVKTESEIELVDWQHKWQQLKAEHDNLQATHTRLVVEYEHKVEQLKQDHQKQMFAIKQENFVLVARLEALESRQKSLQKTTESEGGVTAQLEKEIKEQESLLAKYQQENERLYQELKQIQVSTKNTENRMFEENQRLTAEIHKLREDSAQKDIQLKNKGVITGLAVQQQIAATGGEVTSPAGLGAARIAQAEAELRKQKALGCKQEAELKDLRAKKNELEAYIDHMVEKIDQLEEKVRRHKQGETEEFMSLKREHQAEVDKHKKKLKWYAENQELLDKNKIRFEEMEKTLQQTQRELQVAKSDSKSIDQVAKAKQKERGDDAKKILDLQRQVKEMENIMKKRNPNSLPVLMWAASAASVPSGAATRSPSVTHLEATVEKLRKELEDKDDVSKHELRALEQKHTAIKIKYDERIDCLEKEVAEFRLADEVRAKGNTRPHSHALALQYELESIKERHRLKLEQVEKERENLRLELDSAQSALDALASKKNKSAAPGIKALKEQLETVNKEKAATSEEAELLRKENQQLQTELHRISSKKITDAPGDTRNKEVRAPHDAGSYQPDSFAGRHISEIQRENCDLRDEVKAARKEGADALEDARAKVKRVTEETDMKLNSLRNAHQLELQRILTQNAVNNSASKVAELQAKVDTQEIMLKHLKSQSVKAELDAEDLAQAKIREAALETQVKQLLEDLKEAKSAFTPEMRHFEALQAKICGLEERQRSRESELRRISSARGGDVEKEKLEALVKHWKQQVELKNNETEKFRTELDSILTVLRELQKQGVVLPAASRR